MWKRTSRAVMLAIVLIVTGALSGCGIIHHSEAARNGTTTVEVRADKGGVYHVGGLTIAIPANAIPQDTTLTATPPVVIQDVSAPLGALSVRFDLSFADGAEPSQPLDLAIPLQGGYLPPGADPQRAVLYSPAADGSERLVPTTVDGGVLHARLNHLSPKTITYLDDQTLRQLAGISTPDSVGTPQCGTSVSISAGKVEFVAGNKGWSHKAGSPIDACLSPSNSSALLTISSKIDYLLEVAATRGVALSAAAPGDTDEAMAEQVARAIFPDKAVSAYLGSHEDATALLSGGNLPATVQLRADPSTFLAQAAWTSLKFMVSLLAGKDVTPKEVEVVLNSLDVVDCLRTSLKVGQGQMPSFGEVFNLITGYCGEKIAGALGSIANDPNAWNRWWHRVVSIVIGGGGAIVTTTIGAWNGIRMQFNGTVSVVVGLTPPGLPSQFVGEWHSLRAVLRIDANGTGSLAWDFPDQTLRTVTGQADITFETSQAGITGTYRNVRYRYVSGGTPGGRMPYRDGDTFQLLLVDISLLREGAQNWCRAGTPVSFQQMNCQVA